MQSKNSSQTHSVKILTHEQISTLIDIIQNAGDKGLAVQLTQTLLNYTSGDSSAQGVSLGMVGQESSDSAPLKSYNLNNKEDNNSKGCSAEILKFSEKEINKMPKQFRKMFRYQGCTVRVYRRVSGKNTYNYELRFRRDGYNIYASDNNLEQAKAKFIEKLCLYEQYGDAKTPTIPTDIEGFTNYYIDNFYSRKVSAETVRITKNQLKNHILPHFKKVEIKRITPQMCQKLIDKLNSEEKYKTAESIFTFLNIVFKAAIKHTILQHNPLDMVFHTKHEREHGVPLSKEEEKLLLTATAGTPHQVMYAIALYTGLRPNEYETAKMDGNFIIAINSKRKNGKVEYKKIPITPMLAPYLEGVEKIEFCSLRILRDRFNKLFPDHRLYDLRTTFYTRCQECGVAAVARDEFVGHSLGMLGNTYTELSDEFLYKEGQKFSY